MSAGMQILKEAWEDVIEGDFDVFLLSTWVFEECEVHSQSLTVTDITSAILDEDTLDWHELAFASSESIASLSVCRWSKEHFMAALGLAVIIEYGVRRGFRDWERSFGFLLVVLSGNSRVPCYGAQTGVLRWILCGGV